MQLKNGSKLNASSDVQPVVLKTTHFAKINVIFHPASYNPEIYDNDIGIDFHFYSSQSQLCLFGEIIR